MYNVTSEKELITIGEAGENIAESCMIDFNDWIQQYGQGDLRIRAIRAGDKQPYPVSNVTISDGVATWTYTEADTAIKGYGEVQILYYVGDVLSKSRVWQTYTHRSLSVPGEPPQPYDDWIRQVEESADEARDCAASALESANTAGEYKRGAEAAQEAAEIAQELTDQIKEEAKTAKIAAENARNAAQGYATAAAQSAAQAQETAESIEESADTIQKLLDNQIHDTATGTIASFPDGANMPMVSLVADIEPIQDLHGYDKPWVGGGGKNKFPLISGGTNHGITAVTNSDGSVTLNGTASGIGVFFTDYFRVKAGEYIITGNKPNNDVAVYLNGVSGSASEGARLTIPEDISVGGVVQVYDGKTVSNYTVYPMLRLATETDATYAPYSNICPISGWDSVDVSVAGKNLLNPLTGYAGIGYNKASGTDATLTEDSTGMTIDGNELSIVISASWGGRVIKTAPLKAGDYRVNIETTNSNQKTSVYTIGTDGNTRGSAYNLSGIGTVTMNKTLYDGESIAIWLGSSVAQTIKVLNPLIEIGTTATSYEPYNGQTYHTTLPQTVYGGTLDVVSGELVVDRLVITRNTSDMNNDEEYPGWKDAVFNEYFGNGRNVLVNEPLNIGESYGVNTDIAMGAIWLPIGTYGKTQSEWIALAQDIQITIPLATPQTYQLTPTQIDSLLGRNNVWSDSGDVTVEYIADTKLYIQKVIG